MRTSRSPSLSSSRSSNIPKDVGLPPRPFLYTLDQVAGLLSLDPDTFAGEWVYFDGLSLGIRKHDLLRAQNIAPVGKAETWRITESELIRWMKQRRIRFYQRAYRTT